jgi:predicted DCC family thiol-disulfide oxidoreductase YuxK
VTQARRRDPDACDAIPADEMPQPILLYDGVCGLCNRMVQFVLKRDRDGVFRFASLQSAVATRILARHGVNAADLDTVYVVANRDRGESDQHAGQWDDQILLSRSDAVLFVLTQLGGIWGAAGRILRLAPRGVRDWAYRAVARTRYRIFGRYDSCPLPTEATRARFLDQ